MADIPRERWTGNAQRQLLRDELGKASTARLAAFYWEAIRVLREGDEEIRYAVSGHLLRELQDVLPKHLQVPGTGGGAGEFWGWISVAWERVVRGRPEVVGNELWATIAIDRPLARFLARLHEKIRHYATIMGRKRARHAAMLGKLDPNLAGAPEVVRKEVVDAWMNLNELFNTATHSVDPEQFEDGVELFERLLTDRLMPRTLEKEDAIAAFIGEVESHANA